jgi:hypothetical protein
MNTQDEIEAALDALEIQNPPEEVIDPVDDAEPEAPEPKDDNPPGYIDNIEDWIAAGKNPDDFKGKNAYKAEYERIKEIKELRQTMETIVDGVSEWKEQQKKLTAEQIVRAKQEALEELAKAKEDMDVDAALAAHDKIAQLNRTTAPPLNPVIKDFFAKNPILDEKSSQYDQEFFQDMKMAQHSILNQLTGGDPNLAAQLTNSQIERSLNVAYSRAKELHQDKFVSKRNNRQSAPAPSAVQRENKGPVDYGAKMKNVKLSGKNARDVSAAYDVYEMLKEKDQKAADTFAKNFLGE